MRQRFNSLYELKRALALDSFDVLPVNHQKQCVYCGIDMFEVLYKNELETYVRCNLCNSLWIIPDNALLIY